MAYWLDELPSQSVLDGLEPLPASFRSKIEPCPRIFVDVLPTFETPELLAYEASVLAELGYV